MTSNTSNINDYLNELPTLFNTVPTVSDPLAPVPNTDQSNPNPPSTTSAQLEGLITDAGNDQSEVDEYLSHQIVLNYPDSNSDFLTFIKNLLTFTAQPIPSDLTQTSAYQGFYAAFQAAVGLNPTANTPTPDPNNLGDFQPLSQALGDSGTSTTSSLSNQLFLNSMNAFLNSYVFTDSTTGTSFVDDWNNYMSARTSLATEISASGTVQDLTSFKDLYFAFVSNATESGFESALYQFYEDLKTNANNDNLDYFLPSQVLDKWFSQVQTINLEITKTQSSVTGTDSSKTNVIWLVYDLIQEMIGTLQNVAASQANLLTFYANAQKAYTDLIGKVPTLNRDRINPYVSASDSDVNSLTTAISTTNDAYTEKLKSYRSVLSDQAQQQQSVVNQSNEAVNQQSDLATSLLQTMQTIVNAIFKS